MPDYKNAKIYKLINSENDKIYIGSTCNALRIRLWGHRSDAKRGCVTPVYQEMRRIGAEYFNIVLIELFPCKTKACLEAREFHIIKRHIRQEVRLLNSTLAYGKMSAGAKRKISLAHIGKCKSTEHRQNISNAGKGRIGALNNSFKRGSLSRRVRENYIDWVFIWNEDGKQHSKSFSVKKYGEKRAKRLAEKVQNQIYPLKNSK